MLLCLNLAELLIVSCVIILDLSEFPLPADGELELRHAQAKNCFTLYQTTKLIDWSIMKAFADDNINVTECDCQT